MIWNWWWPGFPGQFQSFKPNSHRYRNSALHYFVCFFWTCAVASIYHLVYQRHLFDWEFFSNQRKRRIWRTRPTFMVFEFVLLPSAAEAAPCDLQRPTPPCLFCWAWHDWRAGWSSQTEHCTETWPWSLVLRRPMNTEWHPESSEILLKLNPFKSPIQYNNAIIPTRPV